MDKERERYTMEVIDPVAGKDYAVDAYPDRSGQKTGISTNAAGTVIRSEASPANLDTAPGGNRRSIEDVPRTGAPEITLIKWGEWQYSLAAALYDRKSDIGASAAGFHYRVETNFCHGVHSTGWSKPYRSQHEAEAAAASRIQVIDDLGGDRLGPRRQAAEKALEDRIYEPIRPERKVAEFLQKAADHRRLAMRDIPAGRPYLIHSAKQMLEEARKISRADRLADERPRVAAGLAKVRDIDRDDDELER